MSPPPQAELLFDLLRWDGPRSTGANLGSLPTESWEALAELALAQQVAPLLLQRLRDNGLVGQAPATVAARLEAAYRASALRTLRIYGQLAAIAAGAAAAGIELVALKGAALAAPIYGNVALRSMGDIDLLAREGAIVDLSAQLADAGYRPIGSTGLSAVLPRHLPTLQRPGAACFVELHWRLSTPEDAYSLPADELWRRLEPLSLPGCRLLGLAPEDLLLHLCVHATYQHELLGVGLRPLCDIAQLLAVRGAAIDWPALLDRAGRWRCRRGLALALAMAHSLVGAAVPAAALAQSGAADLPAGLLAAARGQLFGSYADGAAMPADLALLSGPASVGARAAAIWARLFVSREALARQFQISPRRPQIYAYYLARAWALLRRHSAAALALAGGDPQTWRAAARRGAIRGWLADD